MGYELLSKWDSTRPYAEAALYHHLWYDEKGGYPREYTYKGNDNAILCARSIRPFDDYTRNTLDLAAVPMLHELSHLPVIVDPSHSTGINRLVPPMTLAAAACGADGVIVEVHNDPIHALCDGAQSLTCEQFAEVAEKVRAVREAVTR